MSFIPQACPKSEDFGSCACHAEGAEVSRVSASTSAVIVSPSNVDRKALILWNDSTATAYIKFGLGASSTDFTWRLGSQSGYELPTPIYLDNVSAVWDSANGAMQITELI